MQNNTTETSTVTEQKDGVDEQKDELKNLETEKINDDAGRISEYPLAARRVEALVAIISVAPLTPFEADLFSRVNVYRVANFKSALVIDGRLVLAARTHNNLMSQQNVMSHQLPGELPPFAYGPNNDRYEAVGYTWTMGAENVARGFTTPASIMLAWIASPGHRANLLSDSRHIGVAYNATGHFWTQDFGRTNTPTQPL